MGDGEAMCVQRSVLMKHIQRRGRSRRNHSYTLLRPSSLTDRAHA